jgi:hypothetical protein
MFNNICDGLSSDINKDYSVLKIKCYLCDKRNHVFLDCSSFKNICGNLRKTYNKMYNKS